MDNLDLDKLRALHAAAKLGGPMVSVHIISPGYEHCANLCTRLEGHKSDYPVAMMQAEWADCIAAIYNAFPALADRLEAAERERDEVRGAREAETNHWVSVIRSLDKENLCDFFDGIGAEEGLRDWLADRDARMKALGAAEWLEEFCADLAPHDPTGALRKAMEIEAARLRREAGMSK